jgi:hypothetical protein
MNVRGVSANCPNDCAANGFAVSAVSHGKTQLSLAHKPPEACRYSGRRLVTARKESQSVMLTHAGALVCNRDIGLPTLRSTGQTLGFEAMTEENTLIRRRRAVVIVIYAFSLLWGIVSWFDPDPRTRLLVSLVGSTIMAQFCMIDSRIRGRALPWSVPWLIFFSWPISVPVYLCWSQGIRRIYKPVLYILAFVAAPYVGYVCTGLITWGLGIEID